MRVSARHADKPDLDSIARAAVVHIAAVDTVEQIVAAVVRIAAADGRTVAAAACAFDPAVGSATEHLLVVVVGMLHHLAEVLHSNLVAYWDVVVTAHEQSCAALPLDDVAQTRDIRHACIAVVDRSFPTLDLFGTPPWLSAARTLRC